MKRIMLTVAYDGTDYHGWQWQPNGRSIEEVLNRELSRLLKEDVRVKGCRRTDAGVHAAGNLCVFDSETRIPAEKLCYAINQSLPEDIVVQESREVPADFHPRKWDSVKTYEYQIDVNRFPDPLRRRYAYTTYYPLNVEAMREAACCLVGEHDFASFCSAGSSAETTVRTVLSVEILQTLPPVGGDEKHMTAGSLTFRIRGTGFLYNMVRIITGTLLEVGRGFRTPQEMRQVLEACDRRKAGQTAPPQGLCLREIRLIDPPWERLQTE